MSIQLNTFIKSLRNEKGLTQYQLAERIKCSREYISLLEQGARPITTTFAIPLSKELNFNFIDYSRNAHLYHNFEVYMIEQSFKTILINENLEELETFFSDKLVQKYVNDTTIKSYIIYCHALIYLHIKRDYMSCISVILEYFNVPSLEELYNFNPTLSENINYYSCLVILGVALYEVGEVELSERLTKNTLDYVKSYFFSKPIITNSVDVRMKKTYIALLNNHADNLYIKHDLDEALVACNKAIETVTSMGLLYILNLILKLKLQIVCGLNIPSEIDDAYNQFRAICSLLKKQDYFNTSMDEIRKEYPEIEFN